MTRKKKSGKEAKKRERERIERKGFLSRMAELEIPTVQQITPVRHDLSMR
jgi:hypothetical protein